MFIDDQQGQIIIITVVVEGATGQHLRSKCQLAFHSRSFRVSLPHLLCTSIAAGRIVETGAAALLGGLGTARSHQARLS
jgi:hypothetical protein